MQIVCPPLLEMTLKERNGCTPSEKSTTGVKQGEENKKEKGATDQNRKRKRRNPHRFRVKTYKEGRLPQMESCPAEGKKSGFDASEEERRVFDMNERRGKGRLAEYW